MVVGASIGIAIAPADGDVPDTLLRHAGFALRRAKSGIQPGWRCFELAMDARMQARRTLELDLRRALERCRPELGGDCPCPAEFVVYYQPTLDLRTPRCAASRRWSAGATRSVGWCRPVTSSRWPRSAG